MDYRTQEILILKWILCGKGFMSSFNLDRAHGQSHAPDCLKIRQGSMRADRAAGSRWTTRSNIHLECCRSPARINSPRGPGWRLLEMLALDECQSERSCPSRSVAPLLKASTRANNNNRGGIPKTHPGIPALQQLNTLLKNKHGKAGRLAARARSCDCPLRTDVDTSKLWFHTIPPH